MNEPVENHDQLKISIMSSENTQIFNPTSRQHRSILRQRIAIVSAAMQSVDHTAEVNYESRKVFDLRKGP